MHEVQKCTLTYFTSKMTFVRVDPMAFYCVSYNMRELLPNFC